jgi:two-component system sensor histidine kinase KdpD
MIGWTRPRLQRPAAATPEASGGGLAHPSEGQQPFLEQLSRALIRVVAALLTAALALRVIGDIDLNLTQLVLLAAVLAAAAAFGLVVGFLAAANAFIGYRVMLGSAMSPLDFQSRDTLLLALFGVFVSAVGFYADRAKQGPMLAGALLELGRPLSVRASDGAAQRFRKFVSRTQRGPLAAELGRGALSLVVVFIGLGGAFAFHNQMGLSGSILLAAASVVLVAGQMGGRFGLAAGVSVGIAVAIVFHMWARGVPQPPAELAADIVLFAAIGWGVGARSDERRHERETSETLASASRHMSLGGDELAIRRTLAESLQQIGQGGAVLLFDENGVPSPVSDDPPPSLPPAGDRWREQRLAAEGRDVGVVRWRFTGSDRERREKDQIAALLIDLGASAIVRARMKLEREEVDYQARAEQLRTVLLDAVSHHFRSPLAGILGSVTSILNLPDRHDTSVRNELLLIIKEQANRLSRYVDNFFSLARLESDAMEINPAEVNIEALIYDVWDTFGEAGSARRYLIAEAPSEPIRSDRALLHQIFGNILENAIKYSPEESVVRVTGRCDGAQMQIEVANQGAVVPPASLPRLFDRFYRSQGNKAAGLGLGLYITRRLVEMLGGTVTARGRAEGGLVLCVTLPLSEKAHVREQQ